MRIRTLRLRSVIYACALLAVVMTLAVPATAFAADAKFYYKKPAPNSTTTTATPKIAVYVVDRYGIRYSSNFRLYLDGVRKTPKISYKSRYKKVWIAYYPKASLAAGQHKVVVKVKNVKGHWSTTTWYFKVPPPPEPPGPFAPPPMPITIEARNCHACHLDTSWHPMTNCQACHGVGRPVSWSAYTPDDESAHTASCAGEQPCHGGSDSFPHVLWKDCTTCHNGMYAGISSSHAVEAEPAHASASVLCTKSGCHVASLTAEHYRHNIGGVKLTCATCHSSTSLRIRFAVRSGSTRCESCHSLTAAHGAPAAAHAGTLSTCTGTGCHSGTAISVHSSPGGPGCAACHNGGAAPSLACSACHSGDLPTVHQSAAASHAAANPTCISSLCHSSDVAAVHSDSDGPGCVACHAAGRTPGTACAVCHPGTIETLHPNVGPAHTAPVGGCVTSACHKTDVTGIHGEADGPGCGACHIQGAQLTIACTSCHAGDIEQVHPGLNLKHTASAGLCTMAGCHGTRAATIHGAVGGPGCASCHAEGRTPSTSCAACHVGDAQVGSLHPSMTAAHTAAAPGCVTIGCHAANAATLHAAGGCATCHAAANATVACASCHGTTPVSQHAFAAASHKAPPSACVSALCHASDALALHTKTGGPGCVACHANGRVPSLACTACHAGDMEAVHPNIGAAHTAPASGCVGSRCHSANVTTVHGVTGGPGCGACHAAGATATVTCQSCHPGDLTARHSWATVRHAGTNSACQSSACHVSDVASVHATGLGCVDCHGPGRTASTSCASCHPADIAGIHTGAAAQHAAPAGTCVSAVCHGSSATSLHSTLAYQGCPACHTAGKTPTLACRTCHAPTLLSLHAIVAAADHTAPTGTCVQSGCHGSNIATLHGTLTGEGCSSCHAVGKTLTQACTTCHSGDLTSRHPIATTAHTAPASSCVTGGCHAANVSTLHSKADGPGCVACHAPGKTPSLTCAACHATGGLSLHPGAAVAHTAPASTCVHTGCHVTDAASLHTKVGGPGCAACHADGTTATLTCVTCHSGDLTSRHAFANTAHTAPAGTCVGPTCHVSNVATTHATGLGCVDCHGIGKTPSLLCATCHTGQVLTLHPGAAAAHTAGASLCSQSSCHGTDSAATHSKTGGPSCAACHSAGTTPSTTCAACHVASIGTWHPAPALKHTAGAGTCVTAGCHASDAVALHSKVGGPGCAACHAVDKTATLACSACHAGDIPALHPNAALSHTGTSTTCVRAYCHGTDVSSLHGVTGGPGCVACHAAGKTASVDCSRCHSTSTTVVHAQGAPYHTVTGSCVVTGCHLTNVVLIHKYGTQCAACHSQPGGTTTNTCATCHPGDVSSVHLEAIGTKHTAAYGSCITSTCHSTDVASLHTEEGGPSCAACHAAGKTPTLVCSNCHSGEFPSTHPAPVSAHTSANQACIQPGCHASNAATLHTAVDGPGCAACHAAGVTASMNCLTCHDSGLAERHPSGAIPHDVNEHPCTGSSCHGDNAITMHEAGQWSCWVCHDNDTGEAATNACIDCHSYSWASRHAGASAFDYHGGKVGTGETEWGYWSDGWLKPPYTRGMSLPCATCHVQAGTDNIYEFPYVINGVPINITDRHTQLQNMCIACHGGTVNDWHAGCIWCHEGGMGWSPLQDFTGQDCSRCHQHGMQGWPHSIFGGFAGATL